MKGKNVDPMIELAKIIDDLIKGAKEEYMFLGEVKSGYPDLTVKCKNMTLEKEDLRISGYLKDLLDGKPVFENGYTYSINTGDTVLMTNKSGIFYIIDKVVGI